jgi:hypothetical protein
VREVAILLDELKLKGLVDKKSLGVLMMEVWKK